MESLEPIRTNMCKCGLAPFNHASPCRQPLRAALFTDEVLKTLVDIRVELLRYWSEEKNADHKKLLSDHLNKLDDLIMKKRKQLESIATVGGHNG